MGEAHGIDGLKKVIDLPISLGNAYGKALADGKIDLQDAALLVDPAMKLLPAISAFKMVGKEFKDLDSSERAALVAHVKSTFDLPDDKVEAMIEDGFEVVSAIMGYISKHFIK